MRRYDDDTLQTMLSDPESDRVERKESFKGQAPRTIRESVCAFANDLAGHGGPGVVFIGAHDDGTPVEDFAVSRITAIQTLLKHCAPWAMCSVSAWASPLPARHSETGSPLKSSLARWRQSSWENGDDGEHCVFQ